MESKIENAWQVKRALESMKWVRGDIDQIGSAGELCMMQIIEAENDDTVNYVTRSFRNAARKEIKDCEKHLASLKKVVDAIDVQESAFGSNE